MMYTYVYSDRKCLEMEYIIYLLLYILYFKKNTLLKIKLLKYSLQYL